MYCPFFTELNEFLLKSATLVAFVTVQGTIKLELNNKQQLPAPASGRLYPLGIIQRLEKRVRQAFGKEVKLSAGLYYKC